jgi:phosphotriesterase-related protein
MPELMTTLGPKGRHKLGMILPNGHVFVDLRTPDQPGHAQADPAEVQALMFSELERARAARLLMQDAALQDQAASCHYS